MKKRLTDTKKNELLNMAIEYKKHGIAGNDNTFLRMSKCERYAVGKQWDPEVLEFNKSRKKFSLTINRILPIINQLSGYEAKNPKDIVAKNIKGGTNKGAQILTQLAKHALDQNHAIHENSQCYEDGIRSGRGYMEIDIDYSKDPFSGEIQISKVDPFLVIPDPSCKSYDLNDLKNGAKYVIVESWQDMDEIHSRYPDKKDELAGSSYTGNRDKNGFFSNVLSFMFGSKVAQSYEKTYRAEEISPDDIENDSTQNKYRLTKIYWKEWKKAAALRKPGQNEYINLISGDGISFAKKLIEENPGVGELTEKDKNGNPIVIPVLHKLLMVGDTILEYHEDPFNGCYLFPVFRFCPYFVNGYEFSIVQNLLDVQDQINWSWSQELNLIRQLANTGWRIAKDLGGKLKEFLKFHGSEDGLVLEEFEGGGKIEKLEPTAFPVNYDLITEKGSKHIVEISQVRLEEHKTSENESGKAVLARQNWAIQNLSNIETNYNYTLRLMGECLLEMIRKTGVYSDDEIRMIVDSKDLLDPELLKEAQELVKKQLEESGIPLMEPPQQPTPAFLQTLDPAIQSGYMAGIEEEVRLYNEYMSQVNELAIPIAEAKLLDEIKSLKYGRYGTKTELSAHAETYRIQKTVEAFELNRALIESGQPGLSRKHLVEATDIKNQEEIINDVPQTQMAG